MLVALRVLATLVLATIAVTAAVIVGLFAFWHVFPMDIGAKAFVVLMVFVAPGIGLVAGVAAAVRVARGPRAGEPPAPPPSAPAPAVVPSSAAERALGLALAAVGGLGLISGVVVLAIFPEPLRAMTGVGPQPALAVFLLLSVALLLPCLLGGAALVAGKPQGRPVATIASALLLPVFPVGTALGAWGLFVLLRPRPTAPPDASQTCRHLAPIEMAARQAGIVAAPLGERAILLRGPTYVPSLARLVEPGSPVRFVAAEAHGWAHLDPPRPTLRCAACRSMIAFEDALAPMA